MQGRVREGIDTGMNVTFNRLRLWFLAIFVVATAGVFAYHLIYVWPRQKCEAKGARWAPAWRSCARVIYLPDVTGRPLIKELPGVHKPAKPPKAAKPAPAKP